MDDADEDAQARLNLLQSAWTAYSKQLYKVEQKKRQLEDEETKLIGLGEELHKYRPDLDLGYVKPWRKRAQSPVIPHSRISTGAFEVLRFADEPMQTEDIAAAIGRQYGVTEPAAIIAITASVFAALQRRCPKYITREGYQPTYWSLVKR